MSIQDKLTPIDVSGEDLCDEIDTLADEIQRLREENRQLREALEDEKAKRRTEEMEALLSHQKEPA